MSDSDRGHPIQMGVIVLLLAGGGWWFFNTYEVAGLDEVTVYPKTSDLEDSTFISYGDEPPLLSSGGLSLTSSMSLSESDNPFAAARNRVLPTESTSSPPVGVRHKPLKIAAWALDGFGPTKLRNPVCRTNIARVIGGFDIVALQQVASVERDLIPRLVDFINQSGRRYDYVIGKPTGPDDRPEQLAFLFDTQRVVVDRRQTYSVSDPADKVTFDPLVGWFRAATPPPASAWTFSLVNIRIDLARAPQEVALLPAIMKSVTNDGRSEDDVVIAGLFQADDAYLLGTFDDSEMKASVESRPTDIFGRYQTSNLLFRQSVTSEFVGRGGVVDLMRTYDLTPVELETVTSHLPVYAEFSATEGGQFE
ncbi:MAG: deoxyribonuclease I [Rubripirellula sp.]|nr:deoxyribonuclease I [Rubripirellula sp.]